MSEDLWDCADWSSPTIMFWNHSASLRNSDAMHAHAAQNDQTSTVADSSGAADHFLKGVWMFAWIMRSWK